MQMSERENILGRIREALKLTAPVPGAHDSAASHGINGHAAKPAIAPARATKESTFSSWLPLVGEEFEERVALFQKNSLELKSDFRLFDTPEEMLEALALIAKQEGWKKIGTHRGVLTDPAAAKLGLPQIDTSVPYEVQELESCDAGISECDALVAQTGTVVVTARSAGGRALSVLPPHHVVIASRGQLLADLPDAFVLLKQRYEGNYPSLISFITGPSRTGDIERILVLGAHGPKKLTVLCV
jgi:L-lactate dehydrogenase complex protein LldG